MKIKSASKELNRYFKILQCLGIEGRMKEAGEKRKDGGGREDRRGWFFFLETF